MRKKERRINFRIKMPSVGLTQFLKKVVFDKDKFDLFIENPKGVLESAGVNLDRSVSEDMLMRFKFTMIRARNFISKEKVGLDRFEDVFGVSRFIPGYENAHEFVYTETDMRSDRDTRVAVESRQEINTSTAVENSEKSSETNRGANTSWQGQDALSNSKSDHWSSTKFDGEHILRPEDRFYRAPLLDAITLTRLITQFDIRLKEYGKY